MYPRARHCGARNVILTAVNDYRLDLAKRIVPRVQPINVSKQQITTANVSMDGERSSPSLGWNTATIDDYYSEE